MRPPAKPDAPHFPNARLILMSGGAAIGGIAIGAAGPPAVVSIGVGLVAGPTWGGIVFLLAVAAVLISGVLGIVAFLAGVRAGVVGDVFLIGLSLAIGIAIGSLVGSSVHTGGWRPRLAATPATYPSFEPIPPSLEASGEVTLRLDGVAGDVCRACGA